LVRSCYGHVRDLPEDEFGVEIEKDFRPHYIVPPKSKKIIQYLVKESRPAKLVILACDEDREGEAIAWHLTQLLKLNGKKPYQRIVFHEITKSAIEEALKNPRKIDFNLVEAQQARRILDRIVGYKLSPFLWKKVAGGLSAGRVQSVAVRLIVEREREIENFVPQEYWGIEALLQKYNLKPEAEFLALLAKKDGKSLDKMAIKTKKEAEKIVKDLKDAEYKVKKIEKKEIKKNPPSPFTTSTLQQEAWRRYHFPAKLTMSLAQNLYERGFITYHRTDSLNLSDLALRGAKKFILENYGEDYYQFRKYKAKGRVQEAHEAIRPTYPEKTSENLKIQAKLEDRSFRLYDLIWRRFIASQMKEALFEETKVEISAKNYGFEAKGQTLKFDGFLKVLPIQFEQKKLPPLEINEILKLIKLTPRQHFTQPPPRYTEATLVKVLESFGIGRPSTYAPIISTIQERGYVKKNEKGQFIPIKIGILVNDLLCQHFPKIVDIHFTARMEEDLDQIARGKKERGGVLKEFYQPFLENLLKKYKEISKKDLAVKKTLERCPQCQKPLVIRISKFGEFLSCSDFPKCKYKKPILKTLPIKCPKCQGDLVEKRTKKKKIFFACQNWPNCDFALWDQPTGEKCPNCQSLLVKTKKGKIICSNPNCNFKK